MKIAYFNCFAGASGDMILGSLLDAGLDFDQLKSGLAKLPFSGYKLTSTPVVKKGISGTKFDVLIPHEHHHRGLHDIFRIIEESNLSEKIKSGSKAIFKRLGEAEAKIHKKSVDEIHFHEVGAVDAIIDIVGAAIGFDLLGIQKIYASPLHVGSGTVECAHGTLPVPAPATAELLKGIPVYAKDVEGELVTPTGAAILSTLCERFGDMPPMTLQQTGYGAGGHDFEIPNVLRVMLGEAQKKPENDMIQLIQTNIDDMNPQFYEHIMERLFSNGALDVYMTPIIMKKNRPGIILNVLGHPDSCQTLTDIIFSETTTLGIRLSDMKKRHILKRAFITIDTPWGAAKGKVRTLESGEKTLSPEYEDCKKLANENNIPIYKIYDYIKQKGKTHL